MSYCLDNLILGVRVSPVPNQKQNHKCSGKLFKKVAEPLSRTRLPLASFPGSTYHVSKSPGSWRDALPLIDVLTSMHCIHCNI